MSGVEIRGGRPYQRKQQPQQHALDCGGLPQARHHTYAVAVVKLVSRMPCLSLCGCTIDAVPTVTQVLLCGSHRLSLEHHLLPSSRFIRATHWAQLHPDVCALRRPIYTSSLEGGLLASDLRVAADLRNAFEEVLFQYQVNPRGSLLWLDLTCAVTCICLECRSQVPMYDSLRVLLTSHTLCCTSIISCTACPVPLFYGRPFFTVGLADTCGFVLCRWT